MNLCRFWKREWISRLPTSLQSLTQVQSCRVSIYRSSARSVSRDVLVFIRILFLLSVLLALFFVLTTLCFFSASFLLPCSSLPLYFLTLSILSFQIHFLSGYLLLILLIRIVVCSWLDKGMISLDSRFSVVPGVLEQ